MGCCCNKVFDDIFVIGGEQLYNECLNDYPHKIENVYLTRVHKKSVASIPYKYLHFDPKEYSLLSSEEGVENVKVGAQNEEQEESKTAEQAKSKLKRVVEKKLKLQL